MDVTKPFGSAHVTAIEGEQGSGKSNTGTARTITEALKHITGIVNPSTGEYYDAQPLTKEEKLKIRGLGYNIPYDTIKIFAPNNETRIARIPDGFSIKHDINIWCNYHLFGIQYSYIASWAELIDGLANYKFFGGRLTIDEFHLGAGARDAMSALNKAFSKESFLLRRKRLDVDIIIPHQRLGEWTTRLVFNQWISCKSDENTGMITISVKKKGQPSHEFTYDGTLYWKYYDTEERFKQPSGNIAKAVAQGA